MRRTPEEVLAFLRADGDVTQATCVYLREYGTLTVPAACLRPEAMEFSPDAAPDAGGERAPQLLHLCHRRRIVPHVPAGTGARRGRVLRPGAAARAAWRDGLSGRSYGGSNPRGAAVRSGARQHVARAFRQRGLQRAVAGGDGALGRVGVSVYRGASLRHGPRPAPRTVSTAATRAAAPSRWSIRPATRPTACAWGRTISCITCKPRIMPPSPHGCGTMRCAARGSRR